MSRRPSGSELLAWSLVGAGLGLVAGFVVGEWMGAGQTAPARPRKRGTPASSPSAARGTSATIRAAYDALQADERLRTLPLEAVGVSPGVVELHGWVPDRAVRARAVRMVRAAPGIERLIDCLLVRGEDDAETLGTDVTDQTA